MSRNANKRKSEALGMNVSTAQGRLIRDILYDFVRKHCNECFRCGEQMDRETFSIEHRKSWLHSDDPVRYFFDLDNISKEISP